MKLGVRSKLFLVSVLLIVVTIGVAGFVLIGDLRSQLERQIETNLERSARAAAISLGRHTGPRTPVAIDRLADQLGVATALRVTVIDETGKVLGDSDVPTSELDALENHSNRPEIAAARSTGRGSARRYSRTLSTQMLYLAVAIDGPGERWVVRTARPLKEVDESIATLRRRLVLAALVGLLIAVFMSALASHWLTRFIRDLAAKARTIAGVDEDGPRRQRDELGNLAGSLARLSEQIEDTVSELASERARFATVLESMREGVLVIDESHVITLVNPIAIELLGLTRSPLGRPLSDVQRTPALVELVDETSQPPDSSVEIELPERRLLVRAIQSADSDGWILVIHDITEVHRLEMVRRDFVANVSHELRTPVSIISANAETLLAAGKHADPGLERMLEAIHRSAARMGQLVADLLDLSRLEAGRYTVELEATSVRAVCEAALAHVKPKAEASKTTVSLEIEECEVNADPAALDQVLVNLLDNAIKYTPIDGQVILRARGREKTVRFEVEDNGPGIAPHQRDRVFERFYRLDAGRSRDKGGTGLGLSIVRHLINTMGGKVGVSDGEKTGSLFWVELPRA